MRKAIFVLVVAITATILSCCSFQFPEVQQGPEVSIAKITEAENLVVEKKFARAERQFRELLREFVPGSPEHEVVLYNLVILNMSRKNPKRSKVRAERYLEEFTRIYPRSHFRTSIATAQEMCRETEELTSCRKEINLLKKTLKARDQSIKKLQSEIEAYKKIDWEREEKKRQIQR